jgi:hypothetical protein
VDDSKLIPEDLDYVCSLRGLFRVYRGCPVHAKRIRRNLVVARDEQVVWSTRQIIRVPRPEQLCCESRWIRRASPSRSLPSSEAKGSGRQGAKSAARSSSRHLPVIPSHRRRSLNAPVNDRYSAPRRVRTIGIVARVYSGNGLPVSAHISRERRVTSAIRSPAVGGHGGSLASRLRSGTTRAVMSRRCFPML